MKKTKIRFFINTLSGGGAEKVLVDLLWQLDPGAFDVSLVTVSGGTHAARVPGFVRLKTIVRKGGVRLSRLREKIVYKMPGALLNRLFLKGRQDIEIAYLEGFPTRVLSKRKDLKAAKIAFVHSDFSALDSANKLLKSKRSCLLAYRGFSRVCFVSQKARDGFEKSIGTLDNGRVIHNVFDFDEIRKQSGAVSEYAFQTAGLKIITVGRLTAHKGYDRLIDVAGALEGLYDFELFILGEGEMRPALEQMIRARQIRSVRFLGFQANPYPLMKAADLFVCSSRVEGYSTAVTEAMALGLPVMTTDCAGMDEILANGKHGMLVENSREGIKAGLLEILQHKERLSRLRLAARERSESLMASQPITEYLSLFAEVLQ